MDAERVERLITLILNSRASEEEVTKRIELVLRQYQLWAERCNS